MILKEKTLPANMGIRTGRAKCITNCLWLYNLRPEIQYGYYARRLKRQATKDNIYIFEQFLY